MVAVPKTDSGNAVEPHFPRVTQTLCTCGRRTARCAGKAICNGTSNLHRHLLAQYDKFGRLVDDCARLVKDIDAAIADNDENAPAGPFLVDDDGVALGVGLLIFVVEDVARLAAHFASESFILVGVMW